MGHLGEVHTFYGKQSYLLRLLSSPGGTSIREGTFIHFRGIVQGVLLLRRVRLFGTIEYIAKWVRFILYVRADL